MTAESNSAIFCPRNINFVHHKITKRGAYHLQEIILLGEPNPGGIFENADKDNHFCVPRGQLEIFQEIIREIKRKNLSPEEIVEKMRMEYLSIAYALSSMGVDFRIVFSHKKLFDRKVWGRLAKRKLTRSFLLPEKTPNSFTSFPRDLCVSFSSDISFLNSFIIARAKGGRLSDDLIFSPYGEGGRILYARNIAVVGRFLFPHENEEFLEAQIDEFDGLDMKVGIFPNPIYWRISGAGDISDKFGPGDHLDPESCLIFGQDGKSYLLVDDNIRTAECIDDERLMLSPRESLERIEAMCKGLDIEMIPVRITIPFVLNLLQLFDGRILMSGGDKEIFEIVERIVGKGNVTQTSIPIRLLPLYGRAGIRCMTAHIPEILIGKTHPAITYLSRIFMYLCSLLEKDKDFSTSGGHSEEILV